MVTEKYQYLDDTSLSVDYDDNYCVQRVYMTVGSCTTVINVLNAFITGSEPVDDIEKLTVARFCHAFTTVSYDEYVSSHKYKRLYKDLELADQKRVIMELAKYFCCEPLTKLSGTADQIFVQEVDESTKRIKRKSCPRFLVNRR